MALPLVNPQWFDLDQTDWVGRGVDTGTKIANMTELAKNSEVNRAATQQSMDLAQKRYVLDAAKAITEQRAADLNYEKERLALTQKNVEMSWWQEQMPNLKRIYESKVGTEAKHNEMLGAIAEARYQIGNDFGTDTSAQILGDLQRRYPAAASLDEFTNLVKTHSDTKAANLRYQNELAVSEINKRPPTTTTWTSPETGGKFDIIGGQAFPADRQKNRMDEISYRSRLNAALTAYESALRSTYATDDTRAAALKEYKASVDAINAEYDGQRTPGVAAPAPASAFKIPDGVTVRRIVKPK